MPRSDGLPPLPAVGTIRIEILGAPSGSAWDDAIWDSAVWSGPQWTDATPQSMNAKISWGADDNQGALSIPAAGSWSIQTYDPQRKLDPANNASPMHRYLVPGGAVRILFWHEPSGVWEVVRQGFIDEVEFDMATKQGDIRASDGISVMVKAKLPDNVSQDAPYTLRARARWVLQKAGVPYIQVEPDPAGKIDPAVGAIIPGQSAWQNIATAAYDALYASWVDRKGILRFRYFGNPLSSLVALGGNFDLAIPIDTLTTKLSMEGVYNHIQAYRDIPMKEPVMVEAKTQKSIDVYGDIRLTRERANPTADLFVKQLLLDRQASGNQHSIGTIRPQTPDQLLMLMNLGMVSLVQIGASGKHGTPIQELVLVLGGMVEANVDTGWTAALTTYQPGALWSPEPKTRIQVLNTNKSAEIFTIVGGASGGVATSAQGNIVVSKRTETGDEKRNVCLDFPAINWSGVSVLHNAMLRFYRPYHQDTGGGIVDEIYIKARRITQSWIEVSTVWPGPSDTNTEESPYFCDGTLGVWEEMDVSRIVRAWAPATVQGGGAQAQYGIKLLTYYDQLQSNYDPQHVILSMRLSTMPAYLYLKME